MVLLWLSTLTFIVILSWFVDSPEIESALKTGGLIEHQIECCPEKVSNAVLDVNVDVHLVRQYLTDDVWKLIEDVVERKKYCDVWLCKICYHDLHGSKSEQSIICNSCLEWYHFSWAGVIAPPKMTYWFCRSCLLLLTMLTRYVCRLLVHWFFLKQQSI